MTDTSAGDSGPLAGPHTHTASRVRGIMAQVMLALTPATLFGLYLFGWPAIYLFLVTVSSALCAEALCLCLARRPLRRELFDGSALLTGWLLAMSLPPWAPWWLGALGSLLAIVVAKQAFGGIGQNLFNPAMVARVALLISFPVQMTTYLTPLPLSSADAPGALDALAVTFASSADYDAFSGATLLGHVRTAMDGGAALSGALRDSYEPLSQAWGSVPGSLGETSALLLLLGGGWLLLLRIITWHIPVAMLGTLTLLATLFHAIDPSVYPGPLYHLFSGAALLGAFFIATDLVTSPVTARGQLLFGAGCGLLVFVIRSWTNYPEGVAFAVMLMNAATPLIDHYLRPRVYGRDRRGAPLAYGDAAEKTP